MLSRRRQNVAFSVVPNINLEKIVAVREFGAIDLQMKDFPVSKSSEEELQRWRDKLDRLNALIAVC